LISISLSPVAVEMIPRKMKNVNDYLAKQWEDYSKILEKKALEK